MRSRPEAGVDDGRTPLTGVSEYGDHWWTAVTAERLPSSFAANGLNGQSIVVLANEAETRPDLVGGRVVQAFGDAKVVQ